MKPGKTSAVIALALTWDGARWPLRSLSREARDFLSAAKAVRSVPSAQKLVTLFAADGVKEIRVCWVPCLKGGNDVLLPPFPTPVGARLGFRSVQMTRFGDVFGMVYRRN